MNYTLEQKREALAKGELWWRFPKSVIDENRVWSRVDEDYRQDTPSDAALRRSFSEYFIGPTPPRVLSELEGELLEALKELLIDMRLAQTNMRAAAKRDPAWEGCAEAIQPRVDAAIAAIQKAESTP